MRRNLTVGLFVLFALAIAIAISSAAQHGSAKKRVGTHDSPIEVAGGSIHGSAECNCNNWDPAAPATTPPTAFGADSTASSTKTVTLHGMTNSGSTVVLNDFNVYAATGWLILIFTAGNTSANPNLSFCSDTTKWTGLADCSSLTPQDNESVYLQVNNTSVTGYFHPVHTNRELHFHNTTGGSAKCDRQDHYPEPDEGSCDKMDRVEVVTHPTPTPPYATVFYSCGDEKDCFIRAGK